MTLVFDLDLDIAKMYVHTDNGVCKSRHLKVRARTGQTLTHRQTRPNALSGRIRGRRKDRNKLHIGKWVIANKSQKRTLGMVVLMRNRLRSTEKSGVEV